MAFSIKKSSTQAADPGGEKPAKRKKAFKPIKGSRFVLFVGDEGAILIYIKNKKVEQRKFVADTTPASLAEISKMLDQDIKAPIMLVIDTMDQSYVQQILPPVSSLSVNKLIKRRLDRDFGSNDLKGALLLGREKGGRKDWNFLMIAVENTKQLSAWLNYIGGRPNRFAGINLAAVECEILAKTLEPILQGDQPVAEWKFIVAHNKVGGFRQIILRNNRIMFTRLAQPVGDSSPEVVAGNIEQEILNTIEYMKRMAFNLQSGLDIYIIGAANLKGVITKNRFNAQSLHVLTPYEVAEYTHIEGATQPNDQFADVILAAIIGCSGKHVLTLSVPQFNRIMMLTRARQFQRVAAVLAALGLLGYIGSGGIDLITAISKTEDLRVQKEGIQQKMAALNSKINDAHVNVENVSELIDQYWQLLSQRLSPLPFVQQLVPLSTLPNMHIKAVEWDFDQNSGKIATDALVAVAPLPNTSNTPPLGSDKMVATLTLQFYVNPGEQKSMVAIAKDVIARFKEIYKGYDIKYSNLPASMQDAESISIDLDSAPKPPPATGDIPEVKLTIAGYIDPAKAAAPPAAVPGMPVMPGLLPPGVPPMPARRPGAS